METVHLAQCSGNAKTGPIPVSTTSGDTCPPSCPFIGKGCYAKYGNLGLHWRKVSDGSRGSNWGAFIASVRRLPFFGLWRHNAAGDLPGKGNRIAPRKLKDLVRANKVGKKRGFTYTHKPMASATNRNAVKHANANGFTINLSGNNLDHADKLAALDVGPVVVVLPSDAPRKQNTPAGNEVRACPATYRDDVTCATCGWCAIADRKFMVGFYSHGAAAKTVSEVARND